MEIFTCPSNGFQLYKSDFFKQLGIVIGDTFATTDYAYCRGSTDAWCMTLEYPENQVGAFHVGRGTKLKQITDGLSGTIALGEAAGGEHWPLGQKPGGTEPHDPLLEASAPWVIGNLATADMAPQYLSTSVYGATVERLNKWPVTSTYLEVPAVLDCRSSYDGGRHAVSDFRSDHPRGGQFLHCDGCVHFVSDEIEISPYRALSTIAGDETVHLP
jgi:hypothetical protein